MKVVRQYLLVIEGTNEVIYQFSDPKKFPITKYSVIEIENDKYEVCGRSNWYFELPDKHQAEETLSFLKKLKARMPYDEFMKSDIDAQIENCHYTEWMDIYIRKKKGMQVVP